MGKGTNQHGNGFALATFIAVVRLRSTSTYSHPTFGFATACPALNAECCVGPAPSAFGNATSSLRCAHWSAASVVAIVHRHCFATDTARLPLSDAGHAEPNPEPNPEPLYHSLLYLPYFSFPSLLRIRRVHTRPRSRSLDKPLVVLGVYTTMVHNSQTLQQSSVRLLLALTELHGFHTWTSDVTQAYIQSAVPLMHEVFIKNPVPEFELDPNQSLQLLRPLYGLCESGDLWYNTLGNNHRNDLGMNPMRSDPGF